MGLSGACFLDTEFVAGKLLISHWEKGWGILCLTVIVLLLGELYLL